MKELIKKLVEITGPSGYETAVREAVRAEIAGLVDDIRVDALGSLIARKGSKTADGMRVMLSAHMDEIGIIATHIDENGFVRFTSIGGVRVANCIGGRVQFLNGARGLIYAEKLENPSIQPAMDQLYIDLGATSRASCPVKVGDLAAFERPFLDLNGRLVSKAMDDRVSVAVMIEALRAIQTTPHEIFFVFSTQEEVGLRGATTAGYGIDPELALAVDVTLAGDTPKGVKMEVALGKGPAIKVRDGGMLADSRVVRWMIDTAEKAGIPYQLEVLEGGTTDAKAIQLVRAGVLAGCISIPTRYIHSPSEMVDLQDVQQAVRLLVELVSNPIHLQ
jgi:putative aminopeptidase FrvX